ncbi:MAG: glycosyltransferase family 61 protein [Opitutaceae bacterium]|nr:glycosyltransferase family 61 protein [Opitutaceae bacterium]
MSNDSKAFTLEASDARLLAPNGNVVLADDTWVTDCGFYPWDPDAPQAFRYHPLFLRKRSPKLRRLAGLTLSLAGDYTAYSYGHWLLDSVPRLKLVEEAGYRLTDFDHIYFPCPGPVARRLAVKFCFRPDQLILEPWTDDVLCERLVATSHPGLPGFTPAFAAETLALAQNAAGQITSGRRIAILRDGYGRNLLNRSELYPLLLERGFELLDPRKDHDIPERCRDAEVIFSIEGSNAYDLLFARPGTRVLIITSPYHDTFPYPQSAAGAAGLRLFLLNGSPIPDVQANAQNDFLVAPSDLSRALDILLA